METGEGTVLSAALKEGHLPEAGFRWEPLEKLQNAVPRPAARCRAGAWRPCT